MAKLPIPQRGQPLDLSLMYDIINSINELYSTISQKGSTYASLATSIAGVSPADVKVNNIKMITGYVEIVSQSVSPNSPLSFSYEFPGVDFKTNPIVTATIQAGSDSASGVTNANVIITNVTTSRVEGKISFGQSAQFSGAVHIIAIGQPM